MDQNKAAAEARRRKAGEEPPLRDELLRTFRWVGDRTDFSSYADISGWWRNPLIIKRIGAGLADLHAPARPTVVAAPQSRGTLIGTLVAQHLGIGLVEIRKNHAQSADSDQVLRRTTPPDYRDRHLQLGFRRHLLSAGERVLFVDDWIDTGGQAEAARGLIADAEAVWLTG